jgi:DNA-directed RNA polymerase subunit RPC12/RpoP
MPYRAPSQSPDRNAHDVTLPLDCINCGGKIFVTYEPAMGPHRAPNILARYTCPHCRKQAQIELPGLLVPPVQIRRD